MKIDWNAVSRHLKAFDIAALNNLITKSNFKEAEFSARFLRELKIAGSVLNADFTVNEDIVTQINQLSKEAEGEFNKELKHHVHQARIHSNALLEIQRSLALYKNTSLSPDQLFWKFLISSENEIERFCEKAKNQLAERRQLKEFSDPTTATIFDENGRELDADTVIESLVECIEDWTRLLSIENSWLDVDGCITVPTKKPPSDVDIEIEFAQVLISRLGAVQRSWDRSRFFAIDAKIVKETFQGSSGEHEANVFYGAESSIEELYDQIAIQRVLRQQFEIDIPSFMLENPYDYSISPVAPPKHFTSTHEETVWNLLNSVFHLPMDREDYKHNGLSLRAWLRGYSCYLYGISKIRSKPASPHIISRQNLIERLIQFGLTKEEANLFIERTTFGKTGDLYDNPLIRIQDNQFVFVQSAYRPANLCTILLSKLRRADFKSKGEDFEIAVVDKFRKHSIPAHRFKYKLNGGHFDCDTAAIFDRTLFVFECKNYALPSGNVSTLSYFYEKLTKQAQQVKRAIQHFEAHPELIKRHFGINASWSKIVGVCLHALPFSSPPINGIYFYNYFSLGRFLDVGHVPFGILSKSGKREAFRASLWKQSKPSADDLVRELSDSVQLRWHGIQWSRQFIGCPVSLSMFLKVSTWIRRDITPEETLAALGIADRDIPSIVRSFGNESPMDRVYNEVSEMIKQRKSRIGRNEQCPCGSGKKFKKCCG